MSETPAQAIKAATTRHHNQIEGVMRVMDHDFSKIEYLSLLKSFYGFYEPLEKSFFKFQKMKILNYEERFKTPLLVSDLEAMGFRDFDRLPKMIPWFQDLSEAQLLGILYVIEGSTLGGQVISRNLQKKFEVTPEMGCRFFSSYGAKLGPMWKSFLEVLNSRLGTSEEVDAASLAAGETFDRLGAWLRQASARPAV